MSDLNEAALKAEEIRLRKKGRELFGALTVMAKIVWGARGALLFTSSALIVYGLAAMFVISAVLYGVALVVRDTLANEVVRNNYRLTRLHSAPKTRPLEN